MLIKNLLICCVLGVLLCQCVQEIPDPVAQDAAYGLDARNTFDLWIPESDRPTPLLLYIHGGGFISGDKSDLDTYLIEQCLEAGIAIAACNYRYSEDNPFLTPMKDSARALQYLRQNAATWNIDPDRAALFGSSAGGVIATWIAYNDDLADPESTESVLHESTRVAAVVGFDTPCALDPAYLRTLLGGRAYEHPALPIFFGIDATQLDDPELEPYYAFASPINHCTDDDPPTFLYYEEENTAPLPDPNTTENIYYSGYGQVLEGYSLPGEGIHHPGSGVALNERLNELNVPCTLTLAEDYAKDSNKKIEDVIADVIVFLNNTYNATRTLRTHDLSDLSDPSDSMGKQVSDQKPDLSDDWLGIHYSLKTKAIPFTALAREVALRVEELNNPK